MKPTKNVSIAPAKGRLALLLPGMGAVATTLIAGVEAVRWGLAEPIGSVTISARTSVNSPR